MKQKKSSKPDSYCLLRNIGHTKHRANRIENEKRIVKKIGKSNKNRL